MAMPLQANSLSSITHLAGNPPKYPRNPTERKKESLVLYIARVPGSKDVILTTMKPRLKSVTAEDVMNSLYYLHLDAPSDVFLIEDMQDDKASDPSIERSKKPIARKALYEGSTTDGKDEAPQTVGKSRGTETTLSRAPSGALRFQTVAKPLIPRRPTQEVINWKPPIPQRPRPPPEVTKIASRRPLGPRPYLIQPETNKKSLPGVENIPLRADSQPRTPATGLQVYNSNETFNNSKTPRQNSNVWANTDESMAQDSFTITLIRRDPVSGAQWNVGKIINELMHDDQLLGTGARSNSDRTCSSVLVELTALGYGQFRAPLIMSKIGGGSANGVEQTGFQRSPDSFNRQVHMVWSKAWERKYKQHGRSQSDHSITGRGGWMRSSSDISSGQIPRKSMESGNLGSPKYGNQDSGFLSPWNGHCEFSTDTSGRTLKCKHTLANPPTTSTTAALSAGISASVSELRFNIPSSTKSTPSLAPATSNQQPSGFVDSKINKNQNRVSSNIANARASARYPIDYAAMYPTTDNNPLPKPLPPTSFAAIYPSDDDDEDDADEVLDLSLGREKAGGGNRGKRAKLGKLIVHDEGLKMLDLVVAANMGVWWTVWER